MIAYDPVFLRNLSIVRKAKRWCGKKLLTPEQLNRVLLTYRTEFFSPNVFVKILLFIFTWVLTGGLLSLYAVFFSSVPSLFDSKGFIMITCLLFFAITLVVLEIFINRVRVFRAGIDEALLYISLTFLFSFFGAMLEDVFDNANIFLLFAVFSLPFLAGAVVRYADSLVSAVLVAALYTIFFLMILKLGAIAKMIMPFALMALSVPFYYVAVNKKEQPSLIYWKHNFVIVECISLIVFYAAGNYFVVRESAIEFFGMQLAEGGDIPFAFIFYFLTAAVPLFYVYRGLMKKDKVILWIGLLLVAVSAFTFRYYFSMGHPEIVLTVAGSIMILIAYFSIKYLKTPRYGISFAEEDGDDDFLKTNAEALVIAQTLTQQVSRTEDGSGPGGGDFGGAGAGEKY